MQNETHQRKKRERVRRLDGGRTYNFAFVPKFNCDNSPFFGPAYEGCLQQASKLGNVKCECIQAKDFPREQRQKQELIIANLTARGVYDGMGIAVRKADDVVDAISDAIDAGIPVVTFDSDSPNSRRAAYIGTDNVAMGRELGKVLKQLRPEGGKYALVSAESQNILEREWGIRETLNGTSWSEIGEGLSPMYGYGGNGTLAVERMWELAEKQPDVKAFVPLLGTPMNKGEQWKEFATAYRNRIALVSTDWSQLQMDLLSQGYADGLVGQLPFEMGQAVVTNLHKLQDKDKAKEAIESEVLGTNLIEILRVPLILPTLAKDYNYLGDLTILGYIMFAIVALLAIGFSVWTYTNRHEHVVKASQPMFLFLLAVGVLIFSSTIIPMGIDDENHSQTGCDIACMSIPWLASVGFVLIFSVLFSKTWRVNRLFHNPYRFRRMKVTKRDVTLPLILLMTVNVIVLVCWTILSPLTFVREDGESTDLWNRPTSSTGICKSTSDRKGKSLPYLILIGLINLGALVMANMQAYIARDIETEFSESKWIALVLASILQAAIIGFPIIFLTRGDPTVSYILITVIVFVLSVVILLLIFVPKYRHHKIWVAKKAAKKKKKAENSQALSEDTTWHSEGSEGLEIMMKQSIYVRPGAKVSILRNSAGQGTEDLQVLLDDDDFDDCKLDEEEENQVDSAAKGVIRERSPGSDRHIMFEDDKQEGSSTDDEKKSGWEDNKSTSGECQQSQETAKREEQEVLDKEDNDTSS